VGGISQRSSDEPGRTASGVGERLDELYEYLEHDGLAKFEKSWTELGATIAAELERQQHTPQPSSGTVRAENPKPALWAVACGHPRDDPALAPRHRPPPLRSAAHAEPRPASQPSAGELARVSSERGGADGMRASEGGGNRRRAAQSCGTAQAAMPRNFVGSTAGCGFLYPRAALAQRTRPHAPASSRLYHRKETRVAAAARARFCGGE